MNTETESAENITGFSFGTIWMAGTILVILGLAIGMFGCVPLWQMALVLMRNPKPEGSISKPLRKPSGT